MRYNYNYSLFEFFSLVTEGKSEGEIKRSISDVMSAFLNKCYKQIGITQEIFDVGVFLCSFCEDHIAFKILVYIFENKFPSKYYPVNLIK